MTNALKNDSEYLHERQPQRKLWIGDFKKENVFISQELKRTKSWSKSKTLTKIQRI